MKPLYRRQHRCEIGLAGALATAGLIGWLWLARRWLPALPFVPFDITDLLIRLAPGQVATAGIEVLGVWARRILRLAGVLMMLGAGALLAAVSQHLHLHCTERSQRPPVGSEVQVLRSARRWLRVAALAGLAFAATLAVEFALGANRIPPLGGLLGLLASDYAWAWVVIWAVEHLNRPEGATGGRRQFLLRFGAAALGLAAGGFLVGERLRQGTPAPAELSSLPAAQPQIPPPSAVPPVTTGSSGATPPVSTSIVAAPVLPTPAPTPGTPLPVFVPAAGTRPNVTPIGDFFEVDIGAEAPRVEAVGWKLEVKGLVDRPLWLAFEDLLALPRVDVYGTLECISNAVAGRLIGTTLFSGVRLADVLQETGPQKGATEVILRAVDGYSESMSIDQAMQGDPLLVYGMDGKVLSREHGYPLRLYKPDSYGMKGPKWLAALELVSEHHRGYWARSGWDEEAVVKATSVIDAHDTVGSKPGAGTSESNLVQIGGIAYAGRRGMQEVGVQIDGGAFMPAALDRPLSPFTWVRWRFDWRDPAPGDHKIVVRAIDGNGEEQTPALAPPHPDGASGWHKATVTR